MSAMEVEMVGWAKNSVLESVCLASAKAAVTGWRDSAAARGGKLTRKEGRARPRDTPKSQTNKAMAKKCVQTKTE